MRTPVSTRTASSPAVRGRRVVPVVVVIDLNMQARDPVGVRPAAVARADARVAEASAVRAVAATVE